MSNLWRGMRFWATLINSAVKYQQSPHMTLKQKSISVKLSISKPFSCYWNCTGL